MTVATAPPPVAPVAARRQAPSMRRIGEKRWAGYFFVAPHFLIFALMILIPFVYNVWISLSDYTFGGQAEKFVGLQNFKNLADPNDYHFPIFWNGFINTLIFVVISTPMLVIGGLFLAVLINNKFRGRNVFRAIYFAPWTLGISVVGLLWWWIFNGSFGLLTNFLGSWGSPRHSG